MFEKFLDRFRAKPSADNELDDSYLTGAPIFSYEQAAPLRWSTFDALCEKASAGDADAQSEVGRYLMARGDTEEAEGWFRKAAEQGLAKAKHNLGVLAHMNGDLRAALTWLNEAHEDGWLNSSSALGRLLNDAGKNELAIKVLLPAAQQGHALAQDQLGKIYFDLETPEDDVRARNWSLAAAQQGVPSSIRRLGLMFHEGRVFAQNPERAAAHFLRAAELDDDVAQSLIGVAYHIGKGVRQDNAEAAHWIMRSADQGNELAISYLNAHRGIADLPKADLEEGRRRADLAIEQFR